MSSPCSTATSWCAFPPRRGLDRPGVSPANVVLEHPSGKIEVLVDFDAAEGFTLHSTGLVRTARKLAEGRVFVPARVWNGG